MAARLAKAPSAVTSRIRKRPSSCSAALRLMCDKPRGGAQHIAPGAEDRQRGIGAAQEIADALFGALDPQLGDEGGLAERCILPGLLAERRRVALDVEQVVGDLEGFAKRPAVIV